MAADELLSRIDRSLAARDREQREWWEAQKHEQRDWFEAQDRKHREFLHALTERHVGITQRMIETIDALQREIADQRAQIKANTDAVLRALDRLGPSPQNG